MARACTVGLVALLGALVAVPAAAQSKTPVTLLLNFYANNEHAPFAYGVVKGIFAEESIDLTIKEGAGSGATVNAVIADAVRFGFADAGALARAVSKDAPLKMIGNYVQTSPPLGARVTDPVSATLHPHDEPVPEAGRKERTMLTPAATLNNSPAM